MWGTESKTNELQNRLLIREKKKRVKRVRAVKRSSEVPNCRYLIFVLLFFRFGCGKTLMMWVPIWLTDSGAYRKSYQIGLSAYCVSALYVVMSGVCLRFDRFRFEFLLAPFTFTAFFCEHTLCVHISSQQAGEICHRFHVRS